MSARLLTTMLCHYTCWWHKCISKITDDNTVSVRLPIDPKAFGLVKPFRTLSRTHRYKKNEFYPFHKYVPFFLYIYLTKKNIMEGTENQTQKTTFKFKYFLILFVLGWILISIGGLGKINSEPWGGSLINTGFVIQIVAGILAVWKLFLVKNVKDIFSE